MLSGSMVPADVSGKTGPGGMGLLIGDEAHEREAFSDNPGDDDREAGIDEIPETVLAASSFSTTFAVLPISSFSMTFSTTSHVSADNASSEKRLFMFTDR
jgi:hypothetical protein